MAIPLQANCNLDDPDEMFLWMLVALPGLGNAPLILPEEYLRQWSRRLYMCGARFDPMKQQIEYHTSAPETRWLAPGGQWVEAGTPPPAHMTVPDMKKLDAAQQQEVLRQFADMGVIQPVDPKPVKAEGRAEDVAEEVTE